MEQVLSRLFGRGLTRAHHAINFNERLEHAAGTVSRQRIRDERAAVIFIGVDGLDRIDALFAQLGQQRDGDLSVALGKDFTGARIDNVLGQPTLLKVLLGHRQQLNTRIVQLANVPSGNTAATLHNELLAGHDVECRHVTLQALWHQRHGGFALFAQLEGRGLVEDVENFFGVIPQSTQQYGRG